MIPTVSVWEKAIVQGGPAVAAIVVMAMLMIVITRSRDKADLRKAEAYADAEKAKADAFALALSSHEKAWASTNEELSENRKAHTNALNRVADSIDGSTAVQREQAGAMARLATLVQDHRGSL